MECSAKSRRLFDSFFLEFISNANLSPDFDLLKKMINENSASEDNIEQFLKNQITPSSPPRKSIPRGSPVLSPRKVVQVRNSFDRSITLDADESAEATIPAFYPVKSGAAEHYLESLYPPTEKINLKTLTSILKTKLNLPGFFALPFMVSLEPQIMKTRKFEIPYSLFLEFAVPKLESCQLHEKVFNIMIGRNKRNYLIQSDFAPYFAALIHTHPSLKFLESEPALQSSFAKCIIARTFYALDPELRGRITKRALANSNFCDCLLAVDIANDVSDVTDFFSYEHFYVIFTKMWQLDTDEIGKITLEQLASYDGGRIPLQLCQRFVDLVPGPKEPDTVTFFDFVYFIMAVEDKKTETALRLWYKVCDLDDDGIISFHELDQLYKMQKEKEEKNGMDPVPYRYVLSQMLDLVGEVTDGITMSQLRAISNRDLFWNTFVDFKKFNQSEFKDPLFEMNMNAAFSGMNEWDVFCQLEYARLSQAEEGEII